VRGNLRAGVLARAAAPAHSCGVLHGACMRDYDAAGVRVNYDSIGSVFARVTIRMAACDWSHGA